MKLTKTKQNEDTEKNEKTELMLSMFIVHNILTIELHESVIMWLSDENLIWTE